MNALKMFLSSDTHIKTNRTSNNFVGFSKQGSGSMHFDILCTLPVCTKRGNQKLRLTQMFQKFFQQCCFGVSHGNFC